MLAGKGSAILYVRRIFRKVNIFYPPNAHTWAYISTGKKCKLSEYFEYILNKWSLSFRRLRTILLEKLSIRRICFNWIVGDPFSDSSWERRVFKIIIRTKLRNTVIASYHILLSSNELTQRGTWKLPFYCFEIEPKFPVTSLLVLGFYFFKKKSS